MTQRLYFVGNADPDSFRIAKMDRTLQQRTLIEDQVKYSKAEMEELLAMIDNGNRATGGLKLVVQCFGIFGFVKILEGFYVILITKRSPVALLGGHYIYHIDDTNMINIAGTRTATTPEQARYLQIFEQVDITKNFYFSYTYDITRSLQYNMTSRSPESHFDPNPIFVWNDHLTKCVIMENNSCWKIPIIHGFVDQSKISVLGHRVLMTLVARRSRCFAGARLISCLSRFLKRGVNSSGMVANDVETEQIVNDECTTLFPPVDRINSLPGYTSFLQNRGSIPLFWSQESNTMVAKPPIDLDLMDPFFTATALHFDHLFERYGSSIIVLNLIKAKERVKREGKLMAPFKEAVTYLNQSLPDSKKIKYIAWDMARASKSHDQDVIHHLEEIAENVLKTTGFFHAGSLTHKIPGLSDGNLKFRLQNGVLRTNCIDCLDRTNAAQFVVGKCALGYQVTNFLIQLYALGIIAKPALPFDCVAVNLLNAMYHDHGKHIIT